MPKIKKKKEAENHAETKVEHSEQKLIKFPQERLLFG